MTAPVAREPLAIVVAMTPDRVIGRQGRMPWNLPEDLRHFRRVTMGHAIVMGRRTWESIGRPLPGRRSIVLSRRTDLLLAGGEVAPSFEAAIALARAGGDREPRVIGGATVYARALPLATRIFLTEIEALHPGDTLFPPFDRHAWTEVERRPGQGLAFVTLERTESQ